MAIVEVVVVVVVVGFDNSALFPIIHCLHRAKKEGTIQYGYRKWGTHARVFSQTLAHGNSKNEIR